LPEGVSSWDNVKGNITSVRFDSSVTTVGTFAFKNTTSLVSVDMPNVTNIADQGFYGATALSNVDIPNLRLIGNVAFYGATSLTSIDIPNVTSIGDQAFAFAGLLTNVDIQPNITRIGVNAFNGTHLNDLNCLGTTENCATIKDLMQSQGATFDDSQFHIIDKPTANCSGYSNGTCSACKIGFDLSNNSCICHNGGASIGGTCFPRRYTPAEAAELVGESNTILLYYK
jgi:hypothetical protein